MSFLTALRCGVSTAWLNLLKWMNYSAAAIIGGVAMAYQMYPTYVTQAFDSVPGPLKFVAVIVFCTLVHVSLTKAQKGPGQ